MSSLPTEETTLTKKTVLADWLSGKDFTILDMMDYGRQVNRQDAEAAGLKWINVRDMSHVKLFVLTRTANGWK